MKDDIDHVTSWNLNASIDTSTILLTMTILVATYLFPSARQIMKVKQLYNGYIHTANLQCESNGSFCGGHFHGESILLSIPGLDYAHNIATSSGVKSNGSGS